MSKTNLPVNFSTFLKRWYSDKLSEEAREIYQEILWDLERKSKWIILCNDDSDCGFAIKDIKNANKRTGGLILDMFYYSESPFANSHEPVNLPIYALIVGSDNYYDNMVLVNCNVVNEGGYLDELYDISVSYKQDFSFMSIIDIINDEYKELIKTY